jgi:hypothetical protein
MQCCKQAQPNKENGTDQDHKHSCNGLKHMLLMLVCCLAPLGALLLLNQNGYEGAAGYLVFLLCPLMHLFMMKGMGHKNQPADNSSAKK